MTITTPYTIDALIALGIDADFAEFLSTVPVAILDAEEEALVADAIAHAFDDDDDDFADDDDEGLTF